MEKSDSLKNKFSWWEMFRRRRALRFELGCHRMLESIRNSMPCEPAFRWIERRRFQVLMDESRLKFKQIFLYIGISKYGRCALYGTGLRLESWEIEVYCPEAKLLKSTQRESSVNQTNYCQSSTGPTEICFGNLQVTVASKIQLIAMSWIIVK